MSYKNKAEQGDISGFYSGLDGLKRDGASFQRVTEYLSGIGLKLENPTVTRQKPVSLLERWLSDAPVVETETTTDINTIKATGAIGDQSAMVILSYAEIPASQLEGSSVRFRGIGKVPHVAISCFVGGTHYQDHWVDSAGYEQTVRQFVESKRKPALQAQTTISSSP